MENMKDMRGNIARNLAGLRGRNRLSQEEVAERVGVSRQAVAKWESGETLPDLVNCDALAALYDVKLEDLIRHDEEQEGIGIAPRGKHLFGTVRLGERGQVVLPKKARELFSLSAGDMLVVLGDETPVTGGIAILPSEWFMRMSGFAGLVSEVGELPDAEGKE